MSDGSLIICRQNSENSERCDVFSQQRFGVIRDIEAVELLKKSKFEDLALQSLGDGFGA